MTQESKSERRVRRACAGMNGFWRQVCPNTVLVERTVMGADVLCETCKRCKELSALDGEPTYAWVYQFGNFRPYAWIIEGKHNYESYKGVGGRADALKSLHAKLDELIQNARLDASIDQNDVNVFLDELRDSARVNMYSAARNIQARFGCTNDKAETALREWMNTYSERHPK